MNKKTKPNNENIECPALGYDAEPDETTGKSVRYIGRFCRKCPPELKDNDGIEDCIILTPYPDKEL